MEQHCPVCSEEWRNEYKKCFRCGISYNDKGDVVAADEFQSQRVQSFEHARSMQDTRTVH